MLIPLVMIRCLFWLSMHLHLSKADDNWDFKISFSSMNKVQTCEMSHELLWYINMTI